MTIGILETRDPSEHSGPSDPMLDRAIFTNSTERVIEHEEQEYRFRFSHVARQDNLKAFCRHGDPQRAEVPMLLKLSWLAIDVFADVRLIGSALLQKPHCCAITNPRSGPTELGQSVSDRR
jgi:hypothetical protein